MNAIRDRRDEAAMGEAERRTPVGWALASLALPMLLSSLGTSIANVALPTLATSFRAPFHAVQWVVLAYLVATTTLVVGAGRLGDVTGRRRLLSAGILVFTLASALCGLAPTLGMLVAARALQGVGAATMLALTLAFVGETVPRERTGAAMGLLGTMSAVGTALGPSLGGLLIAGLGWRAIFLVNLPLGAAALVMARRYLPADRRAAKAGRPRFDLAGTVVLALTLASYALAMTVGRGGLGARGAALLTGAALGVALFVRVEARAKAPLVRVAAFQDPALGAGFAMSALVSTVMMATMVVGPFYLARALGLDAGSVGLVLSAGPLVAAMTGVPAGRAVDRFGAPRTTLAGLLGIVAGAVGLSMTPAAAGVVGYVIPIVVITAHYALFQTANNTAVLADVDAGERGVVSGLLNLSRNLGLITGASVMGSVFARASGAADVAAADPAALGAGMRATFVVAAVLVVIALAVSRASRAPAPVASPAGEMS
jgi:MFS family permease